MVDVVKPAVVEVDYSTMTPEQLLAAMDKAYASRDMKLVSQINKVYTKKLDDIEKAKKDALVAELAKVTASVLAEFTKVADKLRDSGKLDGADGIWFAWDFGDAAPALKLTKSAPRRATGEGGGKSSYVANPAKSADLLQQVGSHIMFKEKTAVTIDKQEHVIPAGTTFQQAYGYSINGGWRNRVRMALLKEAGII